MKKEVNKMKRSRNDRNKKSNATQMSGPCCNLSEDILCNINRVKKYLNILESYFCASFEYLNNKLYVQNEMQINQQKTLGLLHDMVSNAFAKDECFEKKMGKLESRLIDIEQRNMINSLVVFGIPQKEGEDVYELIVQGCKELDLDIPRDQIDSCYRLNEVSEDGRSDGIFVQFLRTEDKVDTVVKLFLKTRELEIVDEGESSISKVTKTTFCTTSKKPKRYTKKTSKKSSRKEEPSFVIQVYYLEKAFQFTPKYITDSQPITLRFRQLPTFLDGGKTCTPQNTSPTKSGFKEPKPLQEEILELHRCRAELRFLWSIFHPPSKDELLEIQRKKKPLWACDDCDTLCSGPSNLQQHWKEKHTEVAKEQKTAENQGAMAKTELTSIPLVSSNLDFKERKTSTAELENPATKIFLPPENQETLTNPTKLAATSLVSSNQDVEETKKSTAEMENSATNVLQAPKTQKIVSNKTDQAATSLVISNQDVKETKNSLAELVTKTDQINTKTNRDSLTKERSSLDLPAANQTGQKLQSIQETMAKVDQLEVPSAKVNNVTKRIPSDDPLNFLEDLDKLVKAGFFNDSPSNALDDLELVNVRTKHIQETVNGKEKKVPLRKRHTSTKLPPLEYMNGLKDTKVIDDILEKPKKIIKKELPYVCQSKELAVLEEPSYKSMKNLQTNRLNPLKETKIINDLLEKPKDIIQKDLPEESLAKEQAGLEENSDESINVLKETKMADIVAKDNQIEQQQQLLTDTELPVMLRKVLLSKCKYSKLDCTSLTVEQMLEYRIVKLARGWPAECPHMAYADRLRLNSKLFFMMAATPYPQMREHLELLSPDQIILDLLEDDN